MPKMKIFNTAEKNLFELPPVFNSVERKRFFSLPLIFNQSTDGLRTPTNKTCFFVSAGYFKARHKFFTRKFHQSDIEFVAKQIGMNINEVQLSSYDKATYLRHQSLILNYFGFSPFDSTKKVFIKTEISRMVRVQFRPKLILLEVIQLLIRKKIALPTYNILATLIVTEINRHQSELNKIIKSNLTKSQEKKLDALLEQVTGSGSNEKWRYQITLLKKPSQSTRPSKIRSNITDLNDLLGLYLEIKPIADRLSLSHEYLRYYAYSVLKSQIHQVYRRSVERRYLHLISFIVYQTLKLQDMLIDTLLLAVQSARNATDKEHKDIYYQEMEKRNQSVTNLVDGLQKDFLGTISAISFSENK